MERIALVRATTGEVIHPEVEVNPGDDTQKLSTFEVLNFSVGPQWHNALAHDGSEFLRNGKLVSSWSRKTTPAGRLAW